MDVPVSVFRAELKRWLEVAGDGETIVITDRGIPVAKVTGIAAVELLAELVEDGNLLTPQQARTSLEARPTSSDKQQQKVSGLVRRLRR